MSWRLCGLPWSSLGPLHHPSIILLHHTLASDACTNSPKGLHFHRNPSSIINLSAHVPLRLRIPTAPPNLSHHARCFSRPPTSSPTLNTTHHPSSHLLPHHRLPNPSATRLRHCHRPTTRSRGPIPSIHLRRATGAGPHLAQRQHGRDRAPLSDIAAADAARPLAARHPHARADQAGGAGAAGGLCTGSKGRTAVQRGGSDEGEGERCG